MRRIVIEGYRKGDYTSAYRKRKTPDRFTKKFLDALLRGLPKRPSVLDLGCGPGVPIDSYLVAKGCRLTGVDITEKHLALARKNVPKAKFILGDFSRIKLKGRFDAVVSFYAIFHIPKKEHARLFERIRGLLNKNGMILFTLGTKTGGYFEDKKWHGMRMAWDSYGYKRYKRMLKRLGFEILKAEFEGRASGPEYHFWLLARRQ